MNKLLLGLLSLILSISVLAKEDSLYDFSWLDQDKEIYVLQNRKFRKDGKLRVGGVFSKQVNGAFIDSLSIDLHAAYFFKEDFGIEFSYVSASGDENDTHEGVNAQGTVAFYRKIETALSATLLWSPFYSKINTFNKIFYYDWMIGAGLASLATADNGNKFDNITNDTLTKETVVGFTWTTGLTVYMTEKWSTRIDFRAYHVNADKSGGTIGNRTREKKLSSYYNIGVGLNYTF